MFIRCWLSSRIAAEDSALRLLGAPFMTMTFAAAEPYPIASLELLALPLYIESWSIPLHHRERAVLGHNTSQHACLRNEVVFRPKGLVPPHYEHIHTNTYIYIYLHRTQGALHIQDGQAFFLDPVKNIKTAIGNVDRILRERVNKVLTRAKAATEYIDEIVKSNEENFDKYEVLVENQCMVSRTFNDLDGSQKVRATAEKKKVDIFDCDMSEAELCKYEYYLRRHMHQANLAAE
ncbi:unnamed protein product [Trichogramma brassicae]|uniref:Uncharacterized protein n=1 Tax=Trichogramma brassicae TaxID=86971 RepID=A0A6H5I352_9HYME|nr:unnamed protein product [Trichogramma brassicae]